MAVVVFWLSIGVCVGHCRGTAQELLTLLHGTRMKRLEQGLGVFVFLCVGCLQTAPCRAPPQHVEPLLALPPSPLLLSTGWGFLVSPSFPCVLGGGISCVAYRAQLGRVGGSVQAPGGVGFFQ